MPKRAPTIEQQEQDARPDGPGDTVSDFREACERLGFVRPEWAPGMAYALYARWREDDAAKVFRGLGRRLTAPEMKVIGFLPQTLVTAESWAGLTARGREVGPNKAYRDTFRLAVRLWERRTGKASRIRVPLGALRELEALAGTGDAVGQEQPA